MNTEYSAEWIRPPKELFSREWHSAWDAADPWEYRTARIDETKKKLEDLEIKLRIKRRRDNSPGYVQDLLVDTVTFLNSYIGVWEIKTEADLPLQKTKGEIRMIYPHNTQVMTAWNVEVMGEPNEDNKPCCLIMLSDEGVNWLNGVVHWLEKNEGELV